MNDESLLSWGRLPKVFDQLAIEDIPSDFSGDRSYLPRGCGRSYGDSCLNDSGVLLLTSKRNQFISFDDKAGVLRCESGTTLDEILKVFVPRGWFLPVTPGTKFVTVGGAIANDVHGKNHHKSGCFGSHVIRFELLRSDGSKIVCSPEENGDLFRATIGGLGLTGVILWAEFKLVKVQSGLVDQEEIRFSSLEEFVDLSMASDEAYEFTVAWVDCVAARGLRGIFVRGNYSAKKDFTIHGDPKFEIPMHFPNWALNRLSVGAFNSIYYGKNFKRIQRSTVHYDKFFYPLDVIHNWNMIYGKRGFYQYQFVIPKDPAGIRVLGEIFDKIKISKMASFLAVLKTFGNSSSPGMLSFPKEGITLALDFANYGPSLLLLLKECDQILAQVGGRVYPAKDARMDPEFFRGSYRLAEFEKYIDPKFSSNFWRRVSL